MSHTKKKIADEAIKAFNDTGLGNVNLLDIAQVVGISRGNLAYHFKDKSALLKLIANTLQNDIEKCRQERLDYPAFANLQIDIKAYHKLQKKYKFIFENNTALNHPQIRKVMNEWAELSVRDNMASFAFAIEVGNMQQEAYPGMYKNLALTVWILTYYWLAQKNVRGIHTPEDAERTVWSLIIPHFTEKGIKSFQTFFGKNYLNNMGPAFSPSDTAFVLF